MAAGGQPGGGGGGQAPPTVTSFFGGVVFVLAGGGNFLSQYLSGAYQGGPRVLGLAGASALVGLATALPVVIVLLVPAVRTFLWAIAASWRIALAVILVPVVVLGAILGFGATINRGLYEWLGCAPATEFTVVTTPDARSTADELVDAFEKSTADANYGCATAHGFVYDAPEEDITDAVGHNWSSSTDHPSNPRRDVGPRPDVWLTESTLPVNTLLGRSQASAVGSNRSFGVSPIVLAVPSGPGAPPSAPSLPQALEQTATTPGVTRPDPVQSTVGLLATAALYGADVDQSPQQPDPAVLSDSALEQALSATKSARALPDGDEGDLLCRYQDLSAPLPGLLLSEQAVLRYNRGKIVGQPCPPRAEDGGPPKLVPLYATSPTLDHRVVGLRWPDRPDPPSVAEDFEQWLESPAGQGAVSGTGLRPTANADPATGNLVDRGNLQPGAVDQLRREYQNAHQVRQEILAIDTSGSMGDPGAPGQSRLDVVKSALATGACNLRPQDQIGLWTFPGDTDQVPRSVLAPTASGCPALNSAASALAPGGNTPLRQTILDAVNALRFSPGTAERRLVVVSDGDDTSSTILPTDLLAAVANSQVKVSIVTLGDVTCDADPLQQLADSTGGKCYDPGRTAGDLRDALSR